MNWQEVSDRVLVELCLQGNEEAWRELLRRYEPKMRGVAGNSFRVHRRHPDPGLIEDFIQESLRKLMANDFRALRNFQWPHEQALCGFLKTVVSNTARDYWRRPHPDKEVSLEVFVEPVPVRPKPLTKTDHRILLRELARCLEKVLRSEVDAVRDIAMFLLYYGQKVTASDLAKLYELNVRKVENTIARVGRIAKQDCL